MDTDCVIVIGFSKRKGFAPISKLIMQVEGTTHSHVYLQTLSNSLDRDLIYQASGSSVNFSGLRVFNQHNTTVTEYMLFITKEQQTKILQKAVDTVGTKYGAKQLVGMGIVRIAKRLGIKIKNPWGDGRATYICSELVAEIFKDVLQLDFTQDLDSVGPKELEQFLINKGVPRHG